MSFGLQKRLAKTLLLVYSHDSKSQVVKSAVLRSYTLFGWVRQKVERCEHNRMVDIV